MKHTNHQSQNTIRQIAPIYWSDLEVLTTLIGSEPAKSIIELTNGNLFELHKYELEQLPIEKDSALKLKAALELGRRIAQGKRPQKISIGSPHEIANYLMEEMRYYPKEHFKAVLLDARNQVISIEDVSIGGISSSLSIPREIFSLPAKRNATFIILAHNHPSGDPSPSPEDITITERLVKAGEILGIRILDHIVIGDGKWFSFAEQELI